MSFSRRLNWETPLNRLFEARRKRADSGREIIDLTESNPTAVDLPYPTSELQRLLGIHAGAPYEPHPLGLLSARTALAEWLSTDSSPVSPDDLVLTASTSEAYSFLFKLISDPGDSVVTAVPTYPLLDHLTALDSLHLTHFRLHFQLRWSVEPHELENVLGGNACAVVVVHPNNPTGSFLTRTEQDTIAETCLRHEIPLISDEVFASYRWDRRIDAASSAAGRTDVLTFSLGGLSKAAGLPHWKLGWIRVGGPPAERRRAIHALELIADSYLSVATPVQRALPEILPLGDRIRNAISSRIEMNLTELRRIAGFGRRLQMHEPEGGWTAVLRVPAIGSDEDLVVALLEETGVLIYPGYFFDFPGDGFLVLSLLPRPGEFAEGVQRLTRYVESRLP
jgi:alanine-synthesizing transaminase